MDQFSTFPVGSTLVFFNKQKMAFTFSSKKTVTLVGLSYIIHTKLSVEEAVWHKVKNIVNGTNNICV